jgi:glyoxylase-like metal-dependent hydrolase (beta-lactamase superfamily II)
VSDNFLINKITVGRWKANCYQISYKNFSWIIDPGDDFQHIINSFDTNNIIGILATHGHFDHIGVVYDLQSHFNLPFYIHSKDKRLMSQANFHRKIFGDEGVYKTPILNFFLDEVFFLPFQDKKICVHYLPGHTEGSVVFEFEKKLFTGDIFFYNGLIPNDLPGGNHEKLINSLEFIITNFKGYEIFPGHGKQFLLDEKLVNKFKNIVYEYRYSRN